MSVTISEAVKYIGVDDKTIDLFESSMWFRMAYLIILI